MLCEGFENPIGDYDPPDLIASTPRYSSVSYTFRRPSICQDAIELGRQPANAVIVTAGEIHATLYHRDGNSSNRSCSRRW